VLFFVALNGFFVAAEFAMVKVRSSRIDQLVLQGNRRAGLAQKLVKNLDAYLSACQLGITLSSLALGWIGEPAVARLIEGPLGSIGVPSGVVHTIAFVIAFAIITVLHIVLGELAPKSIAIQRSEGTVLNVAAPLMAFHKLMYPFIWVLNGTANAILRMFGIRPATDGELAHTEDEIRMLVNQSHQSGLIDKAEMVLFENVFDFTDRVAREIMVPRTEMAAIDLADSYEAILEKIAEEQHTRYPVVNGDKDHVVGFLNVKDLYYRIRRQETFDLQSLLRKALFVSESTQISNVLIQMQRNHTQLAVVVDEYGGTAGMITMEDIVEELVGEIQDEFDNELPPVSLTQNGYSVEGRLLVDEVNDLLQIKIDNDEVDTISGWIYVMLGKTPEEGDQIEHEGHVFTVDQTDGARVVRVNIQTPAQSELSDSQETAKETEHQV